MKTDSFLKPRGMFTTTASLAGALLLGCTLLAGCNKTEDATADQAAIDTAQPAADTAVTDTTVTPDATSTAGTLPADATTTPPPTTMGNADDASSMSGSGMDTDAGTTDTGDMSDATGTESDNADTSDTNAQDQQGVADQTTPPNP
jgi:hypothetical protein